MLIRCPTLVRLTRCLGACHGQRRGRVPLTMPLLVLLAFGAFDYGSAYVEGVRLNGAARAGAQQSMYNSNTWEDTDQAEQAALEEYVGHALTPEEVAAMSVSATAEAFCACTAGPARGVATCPDGSSPGQFVRVSMTCAMPLTLPYPWADDEVTVDGQAVVRVR